MTTISFPIIIAEGLDVRFYRSVEDAQRSLEPWWVLDNEGKVYDAEGHLLLLEAGKKRVRVLPGELEPTHADELASLLRDYLIAIKEPIDRDQSFDLSYLVNTCRKFIKPA